jgi:phenylalanyl-tRNA synthetase beta chain
VATQLMIELCGAQVLPGTIDIGGPGPALQTIRLRDRRVQELLGVEVPRARSAEILTALEFATRDAPDGLDVTVPAFRRADVTREADLIEEVARLGVLEDLPATLPSRREAAGRLTPDQRLRRRAADALAAQGLHEVVGWSFTPPEAAERLRIADRPVVRLVNPMSREQSQLRTTLLGSLLDAAERNRSHGAGAIRLFESGAVYIPGEDRRPAEPLRLAALMAGPVRRATWREQSPPRADFFAIKGALAGLLESVRIPWSVQAGQAEPFLHPGRCAQVLIAGQRAGWIGEIHPLVAAHWDLRDSVGAFELAFDVLLDNARVPTYQDVTSYPEVREDLAVIVARSVSAADVLEVALAAGAPLLAGAEVFDVYSDAEQIGPGHVSLALRLSFRAPDRTLTDEEVATKRRKIAGALTERLQGRIRES